jgi:hypothetical protein
LTKLFTTRLFQSASAYRSNDVDGRVKPGHDDGI